MQLGANKVHVWISELDPAAPFENSGYYLGWLSEEELRRYRRYAFDRDRRLFLAGRAQVRGLLSLHDRTIDAFSLEIPSE